MLKKENVISNIQDLYTPLDDECNLLCESIDNKLKKCGFMYRIFGRAKSKESVLKKINLKYDTYSKENKKMQDLIGIRIILYFSEDIDIIINNIKKWFKLVDIEQDKFDNETFKPQRINIVLSLPDKEMGFSEEISNKCLLDNTFEVQIRTIFSEGWHEVEHDFRYKFKDDWSDENEMSRDLNGLFAALEICDRNIVGILDNVSYNKYKKQSWESMIRNRFRLRFDKKSLSEDISALLKKDNEIAKKIFRFSKSKLVYLLYETGCDISFDNVVFLINYFNIKNDIIKSITPIELIDSLSKIEMNNNDYNLPYNSIISMRYI